MSAETSTWQAEFLAISALEGHHRKLHTHMYFEEIMSMIDEGLPLGKSKQTQDIKFTERIDVEQLRAIAETADKLSVVECLLQCYACSINSHESAELSRDDLYEKVAKTLLEEYQLNGRYSEGALHTAIESYRHAEIFELQKARKQLRKLAKIKAQHLQEASFMGDLQLVQLLVEEGADLNIVIDHHSSLTCASGGGHVVIVDYLLSEGATINAEKGHWKCSPLQAASESGQLEIVQRLHKAGALINSDYALHAAAEAGHSSVVTQLLDFGAAVDFPYGFELDSSNVSCSDKRTALQHAAKGGHLDIVRCLLDSGADVNAIIPDSWYRGPTALSAAVQCQSVDMFRLLLDAGADVNTPPFGWELSALDAAAKWGNLEVIDNLLKAGATVALSEWSHHSALELASKGGFTDVVKRLTVCMRERWSCASELHCRRALFSATEAGHIEVVEHLLELETPRTRYREARRSLINAAVTSGNYKLVKLIIESGAEIDDVAFRGHSCTGLQQAVQDRRTDIAELLISAGANVNLGEGQRPPPLHMAAMNGHLQMVHILIDHGVDVHALSYDRLSVLEAAKQGGEEVLQYLREAQAEISPRKSVEMPQLSTITKKGLCSICRSIDFTFETRESTQWHPSVESLQASVHSGCPLCMFAWKQLNIKTLTMPIPSNVYLMCSSGSGRGGVEVRESYPTDVERPRRLKAAFELNHEPYQGKLLPITGNTSSGSTFAQLRKWVGQCVESHTRCKAMTNKNFLPTRLLAIERNDKSVRLIESDSIEEISVEYTTLSHCWGGTLPKSAMTTKANIDTHCLSISNQSLPLTFLHAFEVTRAFGIKYMWIDSLCIIQDSKEDWDRESSMMSNIYLNGYCLISATASADSSEGLYRCIDMDENDLAEIQYITNEYEHKSCRFMKVQDTWNHLYAGPLQRRAWVLQERELSPRILHFAASQVIWECRIFKATEGWPEHMLRENEYPPRLLDSIDTLAIHNIHDLWYQIVDDYKSRSLTKITDMLPAVGGLARIVSTYTKSKYLVGLWTGDLIRGLGWASEAHDPSDRTRMYTEHSRHSSYIAPTWSFASIDGPTTYKTLKKTAHESLPNETSIVGFQWRNVAINITNFDVTLSTSDTFGQISSASLQISAPILNARLLYQKYASATEFGFDIIMRDLHSDRNIGKLYFDLYNEKGSLAVVQCIFLCPQECWEHPSGEAKRKGDFSDLCGIGIAISPVQGKEATFRRIGHIRCLQPKEFDGIDASHFTLI